MPVRGTDGVVTWQRAVDVWEREQDEAARSEQLFEQRRGREPLLPPRLVPPPHAFDAAAMARALRVIGYDAVEFIGRLDEYDQLGGFDMGTRLNLHENEVAPNSKSAYEHAAVVHRQLSAEWRRGCTLGPFASESDVVRALRRLGAFDDGSAPFFRTNPVLVVLKDDGVGGIKVRVCANASWNDSDQLVSINDATPDAFPPTRFDMPSDAVRWTRDLKDRGFDHVEYAKVDKADAYQQHRVARRNLKYQVQRWADVRRPLPPGFGRASPHVFYISIVMLFGNKGSVTAYDGVSKATKALVLHPDTPGVVNRVPTEDKAVGALVDDHILIAAPGHGVRLRNEALQVSLLTGQRDSAKKLVREGAVGPVKEFAGVELDSILDWSRMSEKKCASVRHKLRRLVDRRRVRFDDLEAAIGLLGFASLQTPTTRAYLRRGYTAIATATGPWVWCSNGLMADLRWWLDLWEHRFNGKSFWIDREWCDADEFNFFTDAAAEKNSLIGFGGVFENEWFGGQWPANEEGSSDALLLSINHLELMTMLGALKRWGPRLRGRRLVVRMDNTVAVGALNKGTAHDPALAYLVREIYAEMVEHSFHVLAVHIPGFVNVLADAASRLKFDDFAADYRKSDLCDRFGPARRVAVAPEFFNSWIRECLRLKREQAARQAQFDASPRSRWSLRKRRRR